MGFITNLLNMENAQFKTIIKPTAIKEFGAETSRIENIKPFMVFKDEQIEELIKAKPKTKEQLLEVKGFGEIKVEKYGEGILNIIDKINSL